MTTGNNRDNWEKRRGNKNPIGNGISFNRSGNTNQVDPSDYGRKIKAKASAKYSAAKQDVESSAQPGAKTTGKKEGDCINSSQCGSGYACVGGGCVKQEPTGTSSAEVSGDGAGNCAPITIPDFEYPVFPCGGAPGSSAPTCGNDNCYTTPPLGPGTDPGCGPDECCRYDSASDSVVCSAALCPPIPIPTPIPTPTLPAPPPPINPIGCDDVSDCPLGLGCNGSNCVPLGCGDCPTGFVCTNGICIPKGCNTDSDCPPDHFCVSGVCIPMPDDDPLGCVLNEDCPPGMVCIDGFCEPAPCGPDNPCPPGFECIDDQCLPTCPEGFTRSPEGACVPDPFEPAPQPDPGWPDGPPGSNPNTGDGAPGKTPGMPAGGCSGYCDSYKKLFGEDRTTCGPNSSCDECSECKDTGECGRPILPSPNEPCWCEPGDCKYQDSCKGCQGNPASPNYGDCEYGPDCSACATVYGPCCGKTVSASACASLKTYGSFASTQAMIWAYEKIDDCNEDCPEDTPPVEPCDCNCHNDCPDCQLCNANGNCYQDPRCMVIEPSPDQP